MWAEHDLSRLIACPTCDTLTVSDGVAEGMRLTCARCHRVLVSPRRHAVAVVLILAAASVGLAVGAAALPFLTFHRFGLTRETTLLGAVLRFEGALLVLSATVLALAILLPVARLLLTVWVLLPLVIGFKPWPGAARAFRLAEALRPWAMAEIFAVGAGVTLLKASDLARVDIGPAFWMLTGLVVLVWAQESILCRAGIWEALER
ncbi:paraquat-inducible protein A [Silicimonas algicola]|uniref:Paraquat-inducible protein A n=1 Tax=Silicimonas algicola TaxID=1826607 RepID=A0A316GBH7_9RHOB|nr:paraquat-inducible protein A [Silicimonas algicola]AZQ67665.1 paraquat-inducible protein A [Silicimonas algicola]PWK57933.1 paraquat-inducible protein A [Silicimonas algicola]